MMFEQLGPITNQSSPENTRFFPVASLEDVAIHLQDSDEENHYEYYLVQIRNSRQKAPVPPPFPASSPARAAPQVSVAAATPAPGPEKEDIPYLAENADLLLSAGEVDLARNIYRAILKTGDASDIAYAGLAACSDREGLMDQAIQFAWDSVAFAPNKKGYQLLSQLLVQQGRDQEAAQALGRAIRSLELSIQEKAEYHKMIGNCLARLGQGADAERAYKKALELSPASDEIQANLGSLYLEQGQMSEAKRCYQDAAAANPSNDKAWVGLGLCAVSEGDKETAHDAFARSLELNLRNSTAIFHLVKCAYEIKKYSTAEKLLSAYVEVAPVSPSLLYSLAGLQFHVGKKSEAAITARRILQIKGDHSGARELMNRIEAE
jgi:tetratricopeptide (TPR) repeat protein